MVAAENVTYGWWTAAAMASPTRLRLHRPFGITRSTSDLGRATDPRARPREASRPGRRMRTARAGSVRVVDDPGHGESEPGSRAWNVDDRSVMGQGARPPTHGSQNAFSRGSEPQGPFALRQASLAAGRPHSRGASVDDNRSFMGARRHGGRSGTIGAGRSGEAACSKTRGHAS